jgi:dCTP diphosphatase
MLLAAFHSVLSGGMMADSHKDLLAQLREFSVARDWEQFHDPKNLAEAISIEAAELLELFLWKTTEQSRNLEPEEMSKVEEEVADIMIFLTYMADALGFDPFSVAMKKVEINEKKYPVEKARGSSQKYDELGK